MNALRQMPLVEELVPAPDVMAAVRAVSCWPHLLLLDSALQREPVGRFSFPRQACAASPPPLAPVLGGESEGEGAGL